MQHDTDYSSLFGAHINKLSKHGAELRGCCPFHEDNSPSWSGNRVTGLWKCHACDAQGNAYQFATRVGEKVGMENGHQQRKIVATYDYTDEAGNLLYQSIRYDPKDFRQRRPNGKRGWLWNLDGTRRVLYRLSNLLMAETVYVVEGEKDADRLWSLGIPATTNPQGAGKWRFEYNEYLRGKHVVIIPDNDKVGEQHALQVARSLLPVAAAVKIVPLPGLPPLREKHGEDVSDWLDAGHCLDELFSIAEAPPILQPRNLPPEPTTNKKPQLVTFRRPSELVARPISWLVDQIVIAAMLTVLHACDKVGKTLLAWEIALAVLKKNLLFHTFSTTQGRVVLALLDDPHDLTVQRRDALGLTECEELRIVTPMDADLSDSLAFLAEFKKECEEFKPNLIVLDALHQFAPPGTEEEIFQVFPSLRDLGFTHVKSELKERSKAHKPFSAQEGSRE